MKELNLNEENNNLLDSLESGDNLKEEISSHQEVAKNTLKKDKRVNLRRASLPNTYVKYTA